MSGSIEFRRASDRQSFAGRIDPKGEFKPADKDGNIGLPPGTYAVVIVQIILTEDLAIHEHTHGRTVPRRYADYYTSGLRIEVAEGQTAPVEVVLDSETSS